MQTATITLRAPTRADLPSLLALERENTAEGGDEATVSEEDIERWWAMPRFDPATMARVAEIDGDLVGSGAYETVDDQMHGGGYVPAAHRGKGIGTALMDWLVEQARAHPDVTTLHTWARLINPSSIDFVESYGGFSRERSFFRMKHRSPADIGEPVWPDGLRLVPLQGDALVEAVVRAYDGSFIDHWNFHPAKADEFKFWLESPREDPALWLVAFAGDELAGFCLCHLDDRGRTPKGDLGPIGTTRAYRGIGLGRALLRHGVRALAARGATEVSLGVDTNNPSGAVRLYESNGFTRVHEGRVYKMSL